MNYRRIAISTIAVAALGLAACNNAPTATEAGDAVTPTVEQTVPQESAPAETDVATDPAATGDDATTDDGATAEATTEAPVAPAPGDGQLAALGQIGAAIQLAEAESGGVAYKIDDENDDRAWEIDVLLPDGTGMEVTVDHEGTEVLGTEADDDPDVTELPSTTLLDAISAAIAHTPGTLDDAELDEEDGRLVWKVELDATANGDDFEIHLDPATFQVLKTD